MTIINESINHTEAAVTSSSRLLSGREKLSYASGEVASNLSWNMVAGFLLFYYSDVALLPVAALGTLMLVTRILDALFDPAAGLLVDRTHTRFGKARPYIMFAAIPFAVLLVATFSVPESFSDSGKVIYAYITFTLLGLLYSFLYIPYSALLPMMTRNPTEKVQLGSYRSMGTSIASIVVYGMTMPLVAWIGGDDKQFGFTAAAIIIASVTTVLYFVVLSNCKENLSDHAPIDHVPIKQSFTEMFANPVWRIVFFFALITFVKIGVLVSCIAYFAKDVLEAPNMMSVLLPFLSVAILTGGFFASHLFRRVSKRKGNYIAFALTSIPLLSLPFFENQPTLFVVLFTLANISGGIQGATTFILLADSVDEHEERFANRAEGILVSSVSFGMKVGMAIGAALTAYALGWANYDPAQSNAEANTMLAWLFYGGQFVLGLAQMACLYFLQENKVRAQNV